MGAFGRGKADYLALGDWNTACFECGRKFKASVMKKNWQGYWVCQAHWEPRQTQDFVRNVPDVVTAPWVQPQSDVFRPACTPNGVSAVPGDAEPGCMSPGYLSPMFISP